MQNEIVRDGFFFVGGDPALDFLNTRPALKGGEEELLADFPAVLRWLTAAGLAEKADVEGFADRWAESTAAKNAMKEILAFREKVRGAVFALESEGRVPETALAEVNEALARHPVCFQVVTSGQRNVKKTKFLLKNPEDVMGILANAAADLFSRRDLRRIRKCESCVIHFCDTTKNHTRRWCSMQFCGNRSKVMSYAARKKRKEGM